MNFKIINSKSCVIYTKITLGVNLSNEGEFQQTLSWVRVNDDGYLSMIQLNDLHLTTLMKLSNKDGYPGLMKQKKPFIIAVKKAYAFLRQV